MKNVRSFSLDIRMVASADARSGSCQPGWSDFFFTSDRIFQRYQNSFCINLLRNWNQIPATLRSDSLRSTALTPPTFFDKALFRNFINTLNSRNMINISDDGVSTTVDLTTLSQDSTSYAGFRNTASYFTVAILSRKHRNERNFPSGYWLA